MASMGDVWGPEDAGRGRRKPLAVVVDHRTLPRTMAFVTLAERGWRVRSCVGPPYIDCPMLAGGSCRRASDVKVVVLSVAHPRFAELLHEYRTRAPCTGIVLLLPEGRGPSPEVIGLGDAVAALDDTPSLGFAVAAAARIAAERAGDARQAS